MSAIIAVAAVPVLILMVPFAPSLVESFRIWFQEWRG
jgi:hypothetical protein